MFVCSKNYNPNSSLQTAVFLSSFKVDTSLFLHVFVSFQQRESEKPATCTRFPSLTRNKKISGFRTFLERAHSLRCINASRPSHKPCSHSKNLTRNTRNLTRNAWSKRCLYGQTLSTRTSFVCMLLLPPDPTCTLSWNTWMVEAFSIT